MIDYRPLLLTLFGGIAIFGGWELGGLFVIGGLLWFWFSIPSATKRQE
jgi:hypothetical protein